MPANLTSYIVPSALSNDHNPTANVVSAALQKDPSWFLDSGATNHIVADGDSLLEQIEYRGNNKLVVGNGQNLEITHLERTKEVKYSLKEYYKKAYTNYMFLLTTVPLEIVYTDPWGPASVTSKEGYKYYIQFLDDFSIFVCIYPLRMKFEALTVFSKFQAMVERQFDRKIKMVQADWGGNVIWPGIPHKCVGGFWGTVLTVILCKAVVSEIGLLRRVDSSMAEKSLKMHDTNSRFWEARASQVATSNCDLSKSVSTLKHNKAQQSSVSVHPMITRPRNGIFKPNHSQVFLTTNHPMPVSSLISVAEPQSVKGALLDPKWRDAMQLEFPALMKNNRWDLVPMTPDMNIIGNKWVFQVKYNADGTVERYKARLVAKGFLHTPGLEFF
nr:uncharacterized protein LOC125424275 [Ziziphus jujuba var. spinosa]